MEHKRLRYYTDLIERIAEDPMEIATTLHILDGVVKAAKLDNTLDPISYLDIHDMVDDIKEELSMLGRI